MKPIPAGINKKAKALLNSLLKHSLASRGVFTEERKALMVKDRGDVMNNGIDI
jgi:hypothetical protein